MQFFGRVRPTVDGFRLLFPPEERELLREVVQDVRSLVTDASSDGHAALSRLYPPAYTGEEADKNAEYARLMHGDLRDQRVAALDEVERTLDADTLDEAQLTSWMGAVNTIRLVLGTTLGITAEREDVPDDDPQAVAFAVYRYLSALLEEIIEALTFKGA